VPVPVADISGLVTSGKVQDSKSIAGLLFYLEYQLNSREKQKF
jgi:hypothetical protein